jgi:excisionase family DNA binding protein
MRKHDARIKTWKGRLQQMPRLKYRSKAGTSDEALAVTIPQAARLLGISVYMARRMAKNGELPVVRFGSLVRVSKAKINEILNSVMIQ